MTKRKKEFDCVLMQDEAALRIYEALRDKTREEELAHWRNCSQKAHSAYPRLRQDRAPPIES